MKKEELIKKIRSYGSVNYSVPLWDGYNWNYMPILIDEEGEHQNYGLADENFIPWSQLDAEELTNIINELKEIGYAELV